MSETENHPIARAMRAQQSGDLNAAFEILNDFLQEEPNDPDAHQVYGILLAQTGNNTAAITHLMQSSNAAPERSDYALNAGQVAMALKAFDAAAVAFRRVTQATPENMDAWLNLGNSLSAMGRHEEARAALLKGIEILPKNASLKNALGVQQRRLGDLAGAEQSFRASLDQYDLGTVQWYNLGNTLLLLHRPKEARQAYDRAQKLTPDHAETRAHVGLSWMMEGQFAKGWPKYEWRWKGQGFPNQQAAGPLWDGSAMPEQTLLLTMEQGYGDAFQFAQFIPEAAKRSGAHIVVVAPSPIIEILQSIEGVDVVLQQNTPLPEFHAQAPLMTLPLILGTSLDHLPAAPAPYINPSESHLTKWAPRFQGLKGRKVGLVWRGNPNQIHDIFRSCPIKHLSPLLDVTDTSWINLQKDATQEELAALPGIHNFANDLTDFSDTAAIMSHLDLVVSVCTSTAHLSGALGRPTWVMLSAASDWRWFLDRDDSPWYPTARLFRQSQLHDWDGVVSSMVDALETFEPPAK